MARTSLQRPDLILPAAEAAALRDAYAQAGCILEYGTGGSTMLAAELSGKTVLSVESDPELARQMRDWIAALDSENGSNINILHVDIGVTREWGHPVDDSAWARYPRYALSVWARADCTPDVVLVNGRFRQGCALVSSFLSQKPFVLLFDNYAQRAFYHKVEAFLGQPEMIGRMARFHVSPQPVPPAKLLQVVNYLLRP